MTVERKGMTFVVRSDDGDVAVIKVNSYMSSDFEEFAFKVADLLTDLNLDDSLFSFRSE